MQEKLKSQLAALVPRLRRFARGLTGGNPENADDLVQAACERALSRLYQWKPGTRFDSWMFRILQTVWLNERAAMRRRPAGPAPEELVDELATDGFKTEVTLAAVARIFHHLPEEQRAVILLVCVEGYAYREASEILGVPIGTIMSRLSRGRLALAERLHRTPRAKVGNVVSLKGVDQ